MADDLSISEVCGPFWWKAMEGVAAAINCPPCQGQAQNLVSAMHDLVNLKLGKPVHNPPVFQQVAREYSAGLARMALLPTQRLPICTPPEAEKLERCIQDVKAKGTDVNPWAVCQAAIGCARPSPPTTRHGMPAPVDAAKLISMIEGMLAGGAMS